MNIKFRFLISLLTIILLSLSLKAQDNNQKQVLFVYGGWDGHEPVESRDLFVPWLEDEGYKVFTYDTLSIYEDSVFMSKMDLVIQIFTMSTITKEQENGLLTAIKNGLAIAGWHGGLGDAFRQNTYYQFMVGGQWVAHPGGIIDYEVNITKPEDAIMKGLSDFKMNSEQYYMHVDPINEVLATTKFNGEHAYWIDGAVVPVVWKKQFGKGKVFYSSLGHQVSDFEVDEALTIMKRGILWALGDLK